MTDPSVADVPAVDPAVVASLRDDLAAAGYTVDGIRAALGPVAAGALDREEQYPAELVTARPGVAPAAALARLFVLGRPVARRQVERLLPTTGVGALQRLGLVQCAGSGPDDDVLACFDLRPYAATDAAGDAAWWVLSDLSESAVRGPLLTDHVLGIGGASTTLAQLTVRDRVGRVLDLGTGCAVQTLHARRHADHVVATDLSTRALAVAAFNLALADADVAARADGSQATVELRRGDLLAPVAGETFDLIVSNPPFVITPRGTGAPVHTYRDGGREGDGLVAELVGGVGALLAPGGTAQFLGDWELRRGEDWQDRVSGWLETPEGQGVDAWVVQRDVQDPAEYAQTWLRDGGMTTGPERDALMAAWLDDFAARGVEGVGFGYLTLHRPVDGPLLSGSLLDGSRSTWRRFEAVSGPVTPPLGAHIGRVLAVRDQLARWSDDDVLAARFVVAADVTEERHLRPGEPDPQVVLLRQGGGFGRTVRVDTALAGLVGACDGELAVGQIIGALAVLLDQDVENLRGPLLTAVRDLVADGLLSPAAAAATSG